MSTLPLLQSIDYYEKIKLIDAIVEQTFNEGHAIVREGDPNGDRFYFII